MATYKEIKGVTVQTKDTDPVTNTGSWASGNNTNSPHSGYGGASGTYNAALVAANEPYGAKVELYDGTSWTETGDISTSRTSAFAAGTQPATWLAGGRTGGGTSTNNTETFNGSSWTEVNEMNTTRFASASAGTYTAGIAFSGDTFTDITRAVETWDGTSWSTHPNNYDSDVSNIIAFGTTTAAITAGGFDGPAPRGGSNTSISTSYSYDGSTYTAITAMPQTLNSTTGMGSQTDGLVAGGDRYPAANTANTISWNGTAWSQVQDVPVAVYGWGAPKATTNTTNQTIFCGAPGQNTTTVDWAFPPPTAAILNEGDLFLSGGTTLKGFGKAAGIPAATWASGGDMNIGHVSSAPSQAGTQTAAMASTGGNPSNHTNVEQYNGSTWTETTDVNTARQGLGGSGTTTAALIFGGNSPKVDTESWDGSSWTELNNLNTPTQTATGTGTQSLAIRMGGWTPPGSNTTETWDGTSWTEVSELNNARGAGGAAGPQTSNIFAGGGYPAKNNVEQWDGSSWTEIAEINTARSDLSAAGEGVTTMLVAGGSGTTANTEFWNGSSWTEINNLSTSREGLRGCGTSVAAVVFGGGPNITATEEFTADATLSTVTVS